MNRDFLKYNCPVEATLGMIGGKYKSLILWHLKEDTLRYNQLSKAIVKATPKMLTQQLRELESDGFINRKVYAVVPPKVEYSLTEQGVTLIPILQSMFDWGTIFLSNLKISNDCMDD